MMISERTGSRELGERGRERERERGRERDSAKTELSFGVRENSLEVGARPSEPPSSCIYILCTHRRPGRQVGRQAEQAPCSPWSLFRSMNTCYCSSRSGGDACLSDRVHRRRGLCSLSSIQLSRASTHTHTHTHRASGRLSISSSASRRIVSPSVPSATQRSREPAFKSPSPLVLEPDEHQSAEHGALNEFWKRVKTN